MEDKKKLRCTNRQKKAMVDYMATHSFFANGEYTGPLGQAKALKEWRDLKTVLDELGPVKTLVQWQRTWRDLKKKARIENAAFRRQSDHTGNHTEITPVSETSKIVLGVIGDATSVGIGPEESPIGCVGSSATTPPSPPPESNVIVNICEDKQSCDSPPACGATSNTTGFRRARARARFNPPASIFENLHKQTNSLLQVLIKEVQSNNMLKAEQNALFKEQNDILRDKRTSQHDKENEPQEVPTNGSNSSPRPAESFKFAMTTSNEKLNQPPTTNRTDTLKSSTHKTV